MKILLRLPEAMKLAYETISPLGGKDYNLSPVLLLHGMLDSRKTWKYVASKLANNTGRKVYAIDARNHGDSPWDDRFDFDVLADDLDEFMDQQCISKAILIGHSMGGRTALTLALKKPENVEKLIVEDMTPRNFTPRSSRLIVQLINVLRSSLEVIPQGVDETTAKKTIVQFIKDLLPEENIPSSKGEFDLEMIPLKKDGENYLWKANLDVIEDMLTTDKILQNLSGTYTGKALFLYGTKSFFKVEKDERIPQFFPQSTKLGFEGANHLIHHEFPKQFVAEVSKFITGRVNPQSKY
ncbi:protein ABHD11-like [Uloborus diversus]|uniref:protein ABHD11-like n=1 Tax=Uloborus diversus TaxID=327109 RepID=UPI0024090378|nr:protein ABHD11-like [Uloborus diversus]XP_054713634.1 protein ABHD11-like [Uloborus diversus]